MVWPKRKSSKTQNNSDDLGTALDPMRKSTIELHSRMSRLSNTPRRSLLVQDTVGSFKVAPSVSRMRRDSQVAVRSAKSRQSYANLPQVAISTRSLHHALSTHLGHFEPDSITEFKRMRYLTNRDLNATRRQPMAPLNLLGEKSGFYDRHCVFASVTGITIKLSLGQRRPVEGGAGSRLKWVGLRSHERIPRYASSHAYFQLRMSRSTSQPDTPVRNRSMSHGMESFFYDTQSDEAFLEASGPKKNKKKSLEFQADTLDSHFDISGSVEELATEPRLSFVWSEMGLSLQPLSTSSSSLYELLTKGQVKPTNDAPVVSDNKFPKPNVGMSKSKEKVPPKKLSTQKPPIVSSSEQKQSSDAPTSRKLFKCKKPRDDKALRDSKSSDRDSEEDGSNGKFTLKIPGYHLMRGKRDGQTSSETSFEDSSENGSRSFYKRFTRKTSEKQSTLPQEKEPKPATPSKSDRIFLWNKPGRASPKESSSNASSGDSEGGGPSDESGDEHEKSVVSRKRSGNVKYENMSKTVDDRQLLGETSSDKKSQLVSESSDQRSETAKTLDNSQKAFPTLPPDKAALTLDRSRPIKSPSVPTSPKILETPLTRSPEPALPSTFPKSPQAPVGSPIPRQPHHVLASSAPKSPSSATTPYDSAMSQQLTLQLKKAGLPPPTPTGPPPSMTPQTKQTLETDHSQQVTSPSVVTNPDHLLMRPTQPTDQAQPVIPLRSSSAPSSQEKFMTALPQTSDKYSDHHRTSTDEGKPFDQAIGNPPDEDTQSSALWPTVSDLMLYLGWSTDDAGKNSTSSKGPTPALSRVSSDYKSIATDGEDITSKVSSIYGSAISLKTQSKEWGESSSHGKTLKRTSEKHPDKSSLREGSEDGMDHEFYDCLPEDESLEPRLEPKRSLPGIGMRITSSVERLLSRLFYGTARDNDDNNVEEDFLSAKDPEPSDTESSEGYSTNRHQSKK